jgi:fatty acid desaturase
METPARRRSGNPVRGALVLTLVFIVIFWLPVIGPFTAGFAGGFASGTPRTAVIAWTVPVILVGFVVALLALGPTGINIVILIIALVHLGIALLGALLGGTIAANREERPLSPV